MNIVQVGVNRGNDHLTTLIQNANITSLILVEPFSVHNEYIVECYSKFTNYIIENIAIVPTEEQTELQFYYHINDHPYFEVASIDKNHILKHGATVHGALDESGLRTIDVKCLTLNKLFDKHNLTDIDILYIDAEGFDDVLVRSIDFGKYCIKEIYFEHVHIDFKAICDFLSTKGYRVKQNVAAHTSLAIKQ